MDFGIAFALGLLGSLHCAAMCGPLMLALPAAQLAQKFSGTIELYRPSEPKLDREFQLEPKADGTQTLDVSKLASGLWLVRAKWNAAGEDYFLEQKIKI